MAQVLSAYVAQVQSLLHDTTGAFYPLTSIQGWVNEGRQRVAFDTECIRVLPPEGTNQNQTAANQQIYTFSSRNTLIQAANPGVSGIAWVRQVAVSWGSMKPAMVYMPWTRFNAELLSYATTVQGFPVAWSQYGEGASGTIYLWPTPSSAQAMDWDCVCYPINLASDSDTDAIPSPWDGMVQYYAAYLAYLFAQRQQDAQAMMQRYTARGLNSRRVTGPHMTVNPYAG